MNPNMLRALLLGLIASAILVISPPHASADNKKCADDGKVIKDFQPQEKPAPAPSAPFFTAEGAERTFADYRGAGLVVNFWATWCAPCVREMPSLDRLQSKVKGDAILVLVISEDRDGAEAVRKFYAKANIANLPILLDNRSKLMRRAEINGLPATLLIDPQGNLAGRVVGTVEWDSPEVVAFIRRCLGAVD